MHHAMSLTACSSHSTRIRVRYAETDLMGVVYHANYVIWMEVGRVELLRAAGIRYRDFESEAGLHLAVAEVSCRYIAPARYDDEIEVEATLIKGGTRMLEIGYVIRNAETLCKLAEGSTRHVFLTPQLKPAKLPERFHDMFGAGVK